MGSSINSLVVNARDMYVTQERMKKGDKELVAVIAYPWLGHPRILGLL
ncbi:hypothetical protein [Rothia sp. P5766]